MATQAFTVAQDGSTNAGWDAWGTAIHNALAAMGTIVQTADTGQVSWPGNPVRGSVYEIWRFADTLQSTAPVYLRITYSTNGNSPQLRIQAASGTNGAGTLTGPATADRAANLTFTTTAQQYYISSTTSRLTIWAEADTAHGAGTQSAIWTVERPHDNTGAEIGTGIVCGFAWTNNAYVVDWASQGANLPAAVTILFGNACVNDQQATLIGAQMTAFTLNPVGINHQVQNPLLGILLYWSADLGVGLPGTIPTVTIYGAAHTYINTNASPSQFSINNSYRAMMLYE